MVEMPMVKTEADMGMCVRKLRRQGKTPEECEKLCRAELDKNKKAGMGEHKMPDGSMMKDSMMPKKEMMEY